MSWTFWIDRGGTFTDIVARTPDGRRITRKWLSVDPGQYDDAAVHGMRAMMGVAPGAPFPAHAVDAIKMGTTVATNALLERKGAPTVLAITAGFADALTIGTQHRPQLFALRIVRPPPLHAVTVEIAERVDADGAVLTPLDEPAAARDLQRAFDDGYRAIAIVLMHGDRHPGHERRLAALARRIGFTQVSASHEVSPLIKLVPRGDTTVCDAYLSPVLGGYVG
ncbi:MAG: hydantoinase/oxoprolinase N-terminal domain-containing protein, partial [Rhodospirillaceae bacterium]|nr:hydantoinase/oxoprolinase N-terminal domain-containing protein [Rhodospirillaceae bacterium]